MRIPRTIAWAAVASLVGCAALAPLPATPSPEEIPGLERMAEAGRADAESIVRLAAGLWSTGREDEAVGLLRQEIPEAGPSSGALLAVLGAAEEARGDYAAARDAYLAALPFVASTALAPLMIARLSEIQADAAGGVARNLMADAGSFDHGTTPERVALLLPFVVRSSSEDAAVLSGALTDLATDDLREMGPFELLDRHLVSELVRLGEPDADVEATQAVAQRLGELTRSATVMWGSLERDATRSRLTLRVVRQFGADVWEASDTTVVVEGDLAAVRREAVGMLWTLSVGAPPGGEPLERLTERPDWTDDTILAYGSAILSLDALDHEDAVRGFDAVVAAEPDFDRAAERARVERSLLAVRAAERLPLADEAARLARSIAQTDALLAETAPRLSGPRVGAGEMLGYDRLGGQYLADFVIRLGDGS